MKNFNVFKKCILFIIVILLLCGCSNSYIPVEYASNSTTQNTTDAPMDKTYSEGLSYYQNGNYEKAIECLDKVSTSSYQYEEAQELLEQATAKYKAEVLDKAKNYVDEEEYEIALNLLSKAIDVLPEDGDISDTYKSISNDYTEAMCEEALSSGKRFVKENNYASAITALTEAQTKIDGNNKFNATLSCYDELVATLDYYKDNYRQQLFDDAKEAYSANGYEAAIDVLQNGKSVLGSDTKLLDEIAMYNDCAPIGFSTIADNCFYAGDGKSWTIVDKLYNETTMDCFYNVSCSYGNTKYLLDGNYNLLEGTFVYNGDKTNGSSVCYTYLHPQINIYGDDKLLFSTTLSTEKTSQSFSIDLTNVKYLTIELSETYQSYALGFDHYSSGITDFYIYKNII